MHKQTYRTINEDLYIKKLDNGLTVMLLPKPEMAKTYGLFSTNYGSIDNSFIPINQEKEVTVPDGIAHFLEHKLFEKEDRDVFADLGKLGASPNAYTSFTKTAYLFSATTNIEQNVQTLLDFVQDPYFSEQSVEKEKGIIAQEIRMYDDQPDWQAFMGIIKSMFATHPVKKDIAGTVDSIQNITKEMLYTCYNTFYHPENMIVCIAGRFEAEAMMELIENNQSKKQFDKLKEIKRCYPAEQEAVAQKVMKMIMPVSIPKVTVGIKESTQNLDQEDFFKRDALQSMVLDYFFSAGGPYYQALYDEKLIDGSFEFSTSLEKNFGYSMISSNSHAPKQLADRISQLLYQTNSYTFSEEAFETMKRKRIGQLLRSMNSLEYVANQLTHYYSLGLDFFQFIPKIQDLTLEETNQFVKSWISEERVAVCTIAPQ
ncbi:EF-P 5-aminopentanol modification-associated protein YfmH [Virgibacillus sp. W0430]|uniref:EF-P 5-aminopentanol modification-associated protein YfmH n=1 Tax=Virgibacillus sp. W0430 TaxID=3391580 RepID=UPI003F47E553